MPPNLYSDATRQCIQNTEPLGFGKDTWEPLALVHNQPALRDQPFPFYLPASLRPSAQSPRRKVDALITLIHHFFPQAEIIFLFGDILFLDNHPQPGIPAVKELIQYKKVWSERLGLPIDTLSSQLPFAELDYHLENDFDRVQRPATKKVKIASWLYCESPETKHFIGLVRKGLKKILSQPNPVDILLNDEELFKKEYLGEIKQILEDMITQKIGYKDTLTQLYKDFFAGFSLSAIRFLQSFHSNSSSLCKADASNEKRTQNKIQIFNQLPAETRLNELVASLSYLFHEFYFVVDLLIIQPRAKNIPDLHLILMMYIGDDGGPAYHPIRQFSNFLKEVKLPWRAVKACGEFRFTHKNNEPFPSSNRGTSMKTNNKVTEPMPIPQAQPPLPSQPANSSLANPAPATGSDSSDEDDKAGQKIPSSGASSSSQHSSDKESKPDPEAAERRKKLLEAYVYDYAVEKVEEPDGKFYAKSLLDLMAQNRKPPEFSSSTGALYQPSQSTGAGADQNPRPRSISPKKK